MDPAQALLDAESHLAAGERAAAAEALAAYRAWRRGGGFEPQDGDRRARDLTSRLAAGNHGGDDDGPVALESALESILTRLIRRGPVDEQ